METPRELERVGDADGGVMVRRYDYGGTTVVAADLGRAGSAPAVDIVDETALVVVDDRQFEFEVPDEAEDVSVNGGVLTIRDSGTR